MDERTEYGSTDFFPLEAATADAKNSVKIEKKKEAMLRRLSGRGHDDKVELSSQDVKVTQDKNKEDKGHMLPMRHGPDVRRV